MLRPSRDWIRPARNPAPPIRKACAEGKGGAVLTQLRNREIERGRRTWPEPCGDRGKILLGRPQSHERAGREALLAASAEEIARRRGDAERGGALDHTRGELRPLAAERRDAPGKRIDIDDEPRNNRGRQSQSQGYEHFRPPRPTHPRWIMARLGALPRKKTADLTSAR